MRSDRRPNRHRVHFVQFGRGNAGKGWFHNFNFFGIA
jgi:hypothetical protein